MTSNISKQTHSVREVWIRNYSVIYYSWRTVNYSNHIFCIMNILKSGAAGKWMAMESVIIHSIFFFFLINFVQIKGKKITGKQKMSKDSLCEMTICFERTPEGSSELNYITCIKPLDQAQRLSSSPLCIVTEIALLWRDGYTVLQWMWKLYLCLINGKIDQMACLNETR